MQHKRTVMKIMLWAGHVRAKEPDNTHSENTQAVLLCSRVFGDGGGFYVINPPKRSSRVCQCNSPKKDELKEAMHWP